MPVEMKCPQCKKGLGHGSNIVCMDCHQNLRRTQSKVKILLRDFHEIHCLGVSFDDQGRPYAIMSRNPDTLVEECVTLNPKSIYKVLPLGAQAGIVAAAVQSMEAKKCSKTKST